MERDQLIGGIAAMIMWSEHMQEVSRHGEGEIYKDHAEILHAALKVVKEQEPITPYIDVDEAKCPDCKVKLTRQELLGDSALAEDFFSFCPSCGRPINWEVLV